MKRSFLLLLILVMALCVSTCLVSCNTDTDAPAGDQNTPDNGNGDTDAPAGDDTGDGIDWNNTGLTGIPMIYNSKARFQIVYTAEGGSSAIKAANDLVAQLRELGVDIGDAVSDKNADDVKEYEIIIGSGARHRGDEINITQRELGEDGEIIQLFGTKLLIAAGTSAKTKTLCENYVRLEWKITNKTKELSTLAIDPAYTHLKETQYDISLITIGGVDLSEYMLFIDVSGATPYNVSDVKSFAQKVYDASGYWLNEADISKADEYEHKIIVRYTTSLPEKYSEAGFAAYVDSNNDLIVECAYANAFGDAFGRFAKKYVYDKSDKVRFDSDFEYTEMVSRAYYSSFGAKGDGYVDDYEAIYNTHVYANQCGQTVYADAGKTYYVHLFHNGQIPVKTNVCLGDAKFIIDDTGSAVYAQRGWSLFKLEKDNPIVTYHENDIQLMFGSVSLKAGDTSVPWLADVLVADSMVRFTNAYHKDYVRNGGNLDSGYSRTDAVLIDVNGNIDPTTPLVFDFDVITEIRVIRTDDTPIVFDGGYFTTICNRAVAETQFKNKYDAYARGIYVLRANSIVKNVTHRMQDEPALNTEYGRYGEQNEGYPYHAFLVYDQTCNSKAMDMDLTGHTTYYESKSTSDTPVPMGSYDFVLGYGIGIEFNGVNQYGVEITDQKYWGIMAANGVKNIKFVDCYISRFDAHRGFWNGTLENVTLGHSFNVIGGGELRAVNVTRLTGYYFIHLRGDYGASFEGDMYLINCQLKGYGSYNSDNGGSYSQSVPVGYTGGEIINSGYSSSDLEYLDWDFGYTCYMPKTMYIENFTSGIKDVVVFSNILDAAFADTSSNKYIITSSITYKNMRSLKTVADEIACPALASIPVINETYPEENS